MPRKNGVWINFQATPEEKEILQEYCQRVQRTQSEVLREFVRSLKRRLKAPSQLSSPD